MQLNVLYYLFFLPFGASSYFIAEHELEIAFLSISCLCTVVCCREVSVSIASTTVKQHQLSLCQAKVGSSSLLLLQALHENKTGYQIKVFAIVLCYEA